MPMTEILRAVQVLQHLILFVYQMPKLYYMNVVQRKLIKKPQTPKLAECCFRVSAGFLYIACNSIACRKNAVYFRGIN